MHGDMSKENMMADNSKFQMWKIFVLPCWACIYTYDALSPLLEEMRGGCEPDKD
jgi:hypothetical protein